MSVITVRLPENLLYELDRRAKSNHIPRAEYVRQAIQRMNKEMFKQESDQRLKKISLRVRGESMRVNAEFSQIEYDPES